MRRASIAFTLVLAACGGGGDDDDDFVDCALEDRDDTFVVGLEKTSTSGLRFRLMQSVPAPPARHDNHWTIQIADSGGAPVAGATVVVTPFMPDHGHGTGVDTVVTESPTTIGEYDANPVNLFMPGLWQVFVQTSSNPDDQVIFSFCIPS